MSPLPAQQCHWGDTPPPHLQEPSGKAQRPGSPTHPPVLLAPHSIPASIGSLFWPLLPGGESIGRLQDGAREAAPACACLWPGLLIGDLLFVEQVGPDLARSWMSGGRWGLQGQLPASKGQVKAARGDEWPPYRSGSGGGPKADTGPLFSAGRQEAWLSWGEAPGLAWTLSWTWRAQPSLPKRSLPSGKKVTQFLFPGLCQHGHRRGWGRGNASSSSQDLSQGIRGQVADGRPGRLAHNLDLRWVDSVVSSKKKSRLINLWALEG